MKQIIKLKVNGTEEEKAVHTHHNLLEVLRDEVRPPFGVMPGPKALIINETAGSGGDSLAWSFRRFNVGAVVGKRTWGGSVGLNSFGLMDGGTASVPYHSPVSPAGDFEIENRGVAPDIEVEMDPRAWREGHDLQLEKTIEILMTALRRKPPPKPPRPAFPRLSP